MRKILIFNDCFKIGGAEVLLLDILNHLSTKEYQLTLLLPHPSTNDTLLKEISSNIEVKYINKKQLTGFKKILFFNIISFFPWIYSKLKFDLDKYDLVVCFKETPYTPLFCYTKSRKTLWIHNLSTKHLYQIRSLKERLAICLQKIRLNRQSKSFRLYDSIICVSTACKERFIDIHYNGKKVENQTIEVIYNSINTSKIDRLSKPINTAPPIEHSTFIVVARHSIEKRIDRIVNASQKLLAEGYQFNISIIGDGPFISDIENLIRKHNIEDSIKILGYIDNPYPHIRKSDWLVCTSERESFSLVLLEAIYLDTPTISTDCGGPSEILENGKYGLIVDNSTNGIYQGMKKVLDSPNLRKQYKDLKRECLSRFNHSEWIESIEKIFLT